MNVVAASLRRGVPAKLLPADTATQRRGYSSAYCEMPYRLIELDSLTDRLDLQRIFGRKAPLHVDLGCGDGSFLCALAQRMADKNFLGIERLLHRVRTSARKAAVLENVRLLRVESFMQCVISCRPNPWKDFICCFRIPGQNAAIIDAGL